MRGPNQRNYTRCARRVEALRTISLYFVACGISRLARYNVTAEALSEGGDKVRYFEGTPILTHLHGLIGPIVEHLALR